MTLINLLVAPIRRVVNFPLFQLMTAIAVILLLQAADSRSVFGEIFSALDLVVDFTVRLCASIFEVKSFTKSWLTTGFMIVYVYIAGLLIVILVKGVIRAAVELVARSNVFGLRNAIARERGIAAYRAWLGPKRPNTRRKNSPKSERKSGSIICVFIGRADGASLRLASAVLPGDNATKLVSGDQSLVCAAHVPHSQDACDAAVFGRGTACVS